MTLPTAAGSILCLYSDALIVSLVAVRHVADGEQRVDQSGQTARRSVPHWDRVARFTYILAVDPCLAHRFAMTMRRISKPQ